MGLLDWFHRLLGLGGQPRAAASGTGAPASGAPARVGPPPRLRVPPTGSEEYRLARRRVVTYVHQARTPIRQAAAVRQLWLADLSKVYAQIASSPTALVLDKAGLVGANHEPAFREALALAQSMEPPPEAENAHAALVGWLTSLHAACLALMDARKLRDRAMLGAFREQLGRARRLAMLLVQERNGLFAAYNLMLKPAVKAKRPVGAAAGEGPEPPATERRRGGGAGARRPERARPAAPRTGTVAARGARPAGAGPAPRPRGDGGARRRADQAGRARGADGAPRRDGGAQGPRETGPRDAPPPRRLDA